MPFGNILLHHDRREKSLEKTSVLNNYQINPTMWIDDETQYDLNDQQTMKNKVSFTFQNSANKNTLLPASSNSPINIKTSTLNVICNVPSGGEIGKSENWSSYNDLLPVYKSNQKQAKLRVGSTPKAKRKVNMNKSHEQYISNVSIFTSNTSKNHEKQVFNFAGSRKFIRNRLDDPNNP